MRLFPTFSPHGTTVGFAMGENAETDMYIPGFLRWATKAP